MPVTPEFAEQLEGQRDKLMKVAHKLTGSTQDAEDLTQDTYLRAITHAESFTPGTKLDAWLLTILRNCNVSNHRRNKHIPQMRSINTGFANDRGEIPVLLLEVERKKPIPSAETIAESREASRSLVAQLLTLPPKMLTAFYMVVILGHSYQETAAIQGTKVGTISSRVNRGRERLAPLKENFKP